MTQYNRIFKYLNDFGSITPYEAFRDLGITKLATRISEMKKMGYKFSDEWITKKNRYGEEIRFKRYKLISFATKNDPKIGFWTNLFKRNK